MSVNSIYGLVLAGGASSRMGNDKAELVYHGLPQKDHLLSLLNQFCAKTYISVGRNSRPNVEGQISDKHSFVSPLNGILSAIDFKPDVAWLSVAVDMPDLAARHIKHLIEERDPSRDATCFLDAHGLLPEPLFTIWEPTITPKMSAFVDSGKISPRDLLLSVGAKMIRSTDGKLHANINSPDDLSEWRRKRNI